MRIKEISWNKYPKDSDKDILEDNSVGMIVGSLGSVANNPNSYDEFDFWIANCNFYVTSKIVENLLKIEGIEALDILSPYRFRIAIAKLFSTKEVISDITQLLTKGKYEKK